MAKISEEQQHFLHGTEMHMEYFARNVFGDRYFGSAGWTDIRVWKKFYADCLELTERSFLQTVGSIDSYHRGHIRETFRITLKRIKAAKRKDDLHRDLIVGLFQLLFLVMGNIPRRMSLKRGRKTPAIGFSAFRTLSYSQTEEQMGWLLRSRIEGQPEEYGFGDFFDAQVAFNDWFKVEKAAGRNSTYVDWVRQRFPELYIRMK